MNHAQTHEILDVDPETVSSDDVRIETVQSGLESEENLVRTHAAKVVGTLSHENYENVTGIVPTLIDSLDDERTVVIFESTTALASIAKEEPARVEPAVQPLVDLLDQDPPLVQVGAASVIQEFLTDDPRPFLDELDRLVKRAVTEPEKSVPDELIENSNEGQQEMFENIEKEESQRKWVTRLITANVVAELAKSDPQRVSPFVPELSTVLDVDSDEVGLLTTVLDIVASVAAYDPEEVKRQVDLLVDLLDHYDDTTAATSIKALGYVDDPATVEPLHSVAADEDRDDDLRDLADETANFIEGHDHTTL